MAAAIVETMWRPRCGTRAGRRPRPDQLTEVFKTLRQRISKAHGGDTVAELHYLLAVALDRAGRADEAKGPLEVAADSVEHRFRAAAMLGRIHRDEGKAAEAVEWYERAAAISPPTPEDGCAVLYDLGTTLEGLQEPDRALAVFLELEAAAADHRDVADRVARLSRTLLGG